MVPDDRLAAGMLCDGFCVAGGGDACAAAAMPGGHIRVQLVDLSASGKSRRFMRWAILSAMRCRAKPTLTNRSPLTSIYECQGGKVTANGARAFYRAAMVSPRNRVTLLPAIDAMSGFR
jgi:hypothetical protein